MWFVLKRSKFVQRPCCHSHVVRLSQMGRVCRDREKRLIFRGWSRLCLHAASLSTAEGTSAAATAVARAVRAEAIEKEAEVATEKADNYSKTANASAEVAAASEHAQREAARVLAAEHHRKIKDTEDGVREHQLRRTKMLVRRSLHCKTLPRIWHISTECRVTLCVEEKGRSSSGPSASLVAPSLLAHAQASPMLLLTTPSNPTFPSWSFLHVKITRVCRDRDRASMFFGWTRLYLHAATLSAAEGAAAAAVMSKSARGRAMEEETGAAAASTALVEAPGKVPREWEHRLGRTRQLVSTSIRTGQVCSLWNSRNRPYDECWCSDTLQIPSSLSPRYNPRIVLDHAHVS